MKFPKSTIIHKKELKDNEIIQWNNFQKICANWNCKDSTFRPPTCE